MKKTLKRLVPLMCAVFLLAGALPGWADYVYVTPGDYTGTRSTSGGGVTALAGWDGSGDNGFEIEWVIAQNPTTKIFTYTYEISGVNDTNLSKALSHWILQVTPGGKASDFFNVSQAFSSDSPKLWEPGPGNPGMPGNLYGIKWDTTGDPVVYTVSFDTYRMPVWGSFYAKDGKESGFDVIAYNVGFGTDPTGTDFTNWIAVPNSASVVPVPGALLLLGAGLARLAAYARRRREEV